jgi:streptomycin 6-kinase
LHKDYGTIGRPPPDNRMEPSLGASAGARLTERIRAWNVIVEECGETAGSVLALGTRDAQPVVVKVVKRPGDEWRGGGILEAFDGAGVVRTGGFVDGAVLMERLQPGHSLAALALRGRDDEATEILARVIREMSPRTAPTSTPTVTDLARSFDAYLNGVTEPISKALVEEARETYLGLCESQTRPRLLHGDLHHDNVLFDSARGWLAVDPKGCVGETEYEIGASLRNPLENPDVFAAAQRVERRLKTFDAELGLNASRALGWSWTQAVLAAIWLVEDGSPVEGGHPFLTVASTIRTILGHGYGTPLET